MRTRVSSAQEIWITNMQGIDVKAGVTVSTRNIGPSTDYLHAASVGNAGALTFTSQNPDVLNPIYNSDFNHPHVTLGTGAKLLAQVGESDATHEAGDVTLSAKNTNLSLGTSSLSGLSFLARAASVELDGATVKGGAVDISSDAGDENLLKSKLRR